MRLYTEEQVRGAHIKGILKGRVGTTIPSGDLADLYINELTPIVLPSAEEQEKFVHPRSDEYAAGFFRAMEMIEDQILNQNK